MADNQVILNADVVFDQTKIQQRFTQLERNLKFQNPFGAMSRDVRGFGNELDRATTRVITLGTAFTVLSTASRLIRDIAAATITVEKSLTSVNTIFRLTTDNLNKLSGSLFDISRETAQSFEKVAEAAQEFARQGLSVAETQKAVRAALMLSRDANIDVAESVRAITAATNSFNKEALSRLQIVNRLASVDAAFAVSSKDLSAALIRTGSAAADAGVSFNQFIGLVTAAQQISQRGGAVIAGALNTIFTRVNRKDTLDALDSLGIAIHDVRGQALPTIEVLRNFATAYDKMTGSIKNQAAELVGGVRQLNTLKATLTDLASAGSVFSQVQQVIARNSNEIERRNAARNQTLGAQASQIGTTAQQIGSNIGNVGFAGNVKPLLNQLINNPLTQALSEANGSAESAGGKAAETFLRGFGASIVFGLGPIIAKVLVSITQQVGGNLLKDVAAITGLNSLEKQRLAIESELVTVYKAGGAELQKHLATMTGIAQQTAYVKSLMGQGIGSGVVPIRAMSDEILRTGGLGRKPRIPGMAGGYIPYAEEMAAVNAGVGGATPGSKPVLLNNFNFGGGKVGQIVANTSEYIVPHFAAGGGSAIFNQSMVQKMGLPPGAKPIAAGGYVPNAAGGMQPYDYYQGLGLTNPLPTVSPPPLSSSVSAAQLAKDFERAQREIAQATKEQARLAKQRLQQMEDDFKEAEKGNRLQSKKTGLTKAEVTLAEKRLAEYQAAQAEARAALTTAYTNAKLGAKAAAAAVAPIPHPYEIRPVLMGARSPYQVSNEGILAAARLTQISSANANAFIGPRTPAGWAPPVSPSAAPAGPVGSSLWSRINARAGSTSGSIALGLGLPFIGGMIGEGVGGTTGGVARGAASSGLQAAGTGSVFGSLIGGPAGTLAGAGIGAVFGGLYGAISKATKSFDELSLELDQKTKKLGEELSSASEVFRIQSDLRDAMLSDNQEQVISLKQQRAAAMAKVKNPAYLSTISKYLSNPEQGGVEIARAGNSVIGPNITQSNLLRSMASAPQGAQTGAMAGGLLGSLFGFGVPGIGIGSAIGGIFDGAPNKASKESATGAVMSAISSLSSTQLEQLRATAKKDLPQALKIVAKMAGLDAKQTSDFVASSRGGGLGHHAVFSAINSLSLREKLPAGTDDAMLNNSRNLTSLAAHYGTQGAYAGITGGANTQISQVRNQIALANPALSDEAKLRLLLTQGATGISDQAATQQSMELFGGKQKLTSILAAGGGSQAAADLVGGITSPAGAKALAQRLSTREGREGLGSMDLGPNSAFTKALQELISELDKSTFAEKESMRANAKIYESNLAKLRFDQSYLGALNADAGKVAAANKAVAVAITQNAGSAVIEPLLRGQEEIGYDAERRKGTTGYSDRGLRALQTRLGLEGGISSGRQSRQAVLDLMQTNPGLITGGDLSAARFGNAQDLGRQGNSGASLKGGFGSVFAGLKQDMLQFAEVGRAVAQSLNDSLGNAFGDFVTGAKSGKDAFRGFAVSVLGDASRLLASKALSSLLGMAFSGFGASSGGSIGFAAGGMVPAMLTGGEYVVGPNAARRIGYDTLRRMNGMAEGGMVNGGSGVRDDVPARLAPGSFVIKKSSTGRIGADYLNALVAGQVQHRSIGGILLGALLGGGAGYLAGGKKGAIGGALLGGIGGYMAGANTPSAWSDAGMGVAARQAGAATLTVGQKIGLGLGASAGLGMLSAGISQGPSAPGPLADSQLNGYRQQLEAAQATTFGQRPAPYPILQVGPQGQQYMSGYTDGPATRRWAEGGGVDVPLTVGSAAAKSSGGAASVSIKIDINNNGTTSATSSTSDGGGGAFQGDFANKLQKTVQGLVQQELVNQSRSDGFFAQRGRYLQR